MYYLTCIPYREWDDHHCKKEARPGSLLLWESAFSKALLYLTEIVRIVKIEGVRDNYIGTLPPPE